MRTLQGWLGRHGRPLALYTDKNSLFVTSLPVQWQEQLEDKPARTQFGRALAELDIEWIAAHSPQAKGRVERLFGTLQDRLVKEMRLAEIDTEQANRFLEITFWPFWNRRFSVQPAQRSDAHRRLERTQRLPEILSVRVARTVGSDHTVTWKGHRWGYGEKTSVWVYAALAWKSKSGSTAQTGSASAAVTCLWQPARRLCDPQVLPAYGPTGLADRKSKPQTQSKTHYSPPPDHPWRKSWKRTFLNGNKPDISTLR